MQATIITILGHNFIAGVEDNTYYIAVPSLEKALGWRADSGREKLESKKLKTLADKTSKQIANGKTYIQHGTKHYSSVTTDTLMLVLQMEAEKANVHVIPFLVALAQESIERRIDAALNLSRTEEAIEAKTVETYKSLREQWLENREHSKEVHGAFQNACVRWSIPANHAHDRITKAITGMTAANARQLPVVDGNETIGLNHQPEETPENLRAITEVKYKFSSMTRRKSETWQEMVDRAITAVVAP